MQRALQRRRRERRPVAMGVGRRPTEALSRTLPQLPRPTLASLIGLVVVGAGVLVGTTALDDNGILTHLATGRLILDDGLLNVPSTDPFTFSATGTPWVVQSWLATVLFAGAEQLGGPAGLILLRGVLTGLLGGLVWALTRPAGSVVPRLGIAVLVVVVGTNAWSERPLLIGLICLALALLAAEGRIDRRWLLPVFWVWVNCHGSFPLGIVALAVLALGRHLDGERPVVEVGALRWAAIGTVLGAVSPVGPRLLTFPLQLLSRQEALSDVIEWQAPRFTAFDDRAFLALLVLAVVFVARRPSWRMALATATFGAAALVAARNMGPASLVFLPGLSRAVEGVGSLTGDERRPIFTPVAAVLVALLALVTVSRSSNGFNGAIYPVAAVSWLEDEGFTEPGNRIVSQDFVGNYFEARIDTRPLVFMDDRFDMLPTDVLDDYHVLLNAAPGWAEVLERREPDAVVWQVRAGLGQLLLASPDWRVTYADQDWLVATPRQN